MQNHLIRGLSELCETERAECASRDMSCVQGPCSEHFARTARSAAATHVVNEFTKESTFAFSLRAVRFARRAHPGTHQQASNFSVRTHELSLHYLAMRLRLHATHSPSPDRFAQLPLAHSPCLASERCC